MWAVALHSITVSAQLLQVLDVVLATAAGNDVVNLQDGERELAAATVAPALLLAEQDVLVLAVRHRRIDVGAPGSVGAGTRRLWNRSPMDCCRRMLTSSTALGEMSMPIQLWPRFSAATQAVAQPQNGSSTTTPSLGDVLMLPLSSGIRKNNPQLGGVELLHICSSLDRNCVSSGGHRPQPPQRYRPARRSCGWS